MSAKIDQLAQNIAEVISRADLLMDKFEKNKGELASAQSQLRGELNTVKQSVASLSTSDKKQDNTLSTLDKKILSVQSSLHTYNNQKADKRELNQSLQNYIKKDEMVLKATFHHASTLKIDHRSTIVNTDANAIWFVFYYPKGTGTNLEVLSAHEQNYWYVGYRSPGIKISVLSYGQST